MKKVLSIIFLLLSVNGFSQNSDFILFRKHDRTIRTYFTGTDIGFTDSNGSYVEGNITAINHDSIFLKGYIIRQVPTQLGVYLLDTSYFYTQYSYHQIKAIGKSGRHFDWGASGSVLMGGGILLTAASAVIYFVDNKQFSPELMGAAIGLTAIGYLLTRVSGKGMVIGKKYTLDYIKAGVNK